MEKLKCSFPTSCKQNYPQFNEIASYTHSHNADDYEIPFIHLYQTWLKLSIVIFIFTIVLIGGAVYLKNVADYKQAEKETTFDEINISDVSDRKSTRLNSSHWQ